MKNVLKIYVKIEDVLEVKGHMATAVMLHFSGHAEGEFFNGRILPHGVDCQTRDLEKTLLSARYILEGADFTGQSCKIFIENNGIDDGKNPVVTSPKIYTDSEALSWLEEASLSGNIGMENDTVVINITANTNKGD